MSKYKQSHDILKTLRSTIDDNSLTSIYNPSYYFEYNRCNNNNKKIAINMEVWKLDNVSYTHFQFKGTYNIESRVFEEYQPTTLMVEGVNIPFNINDKITQKLMGKLLDKIILNIIHSPVDTNIKISAGEALLL